MITGASPALSSRAKPRGLYSRRENGECKIAWKRCKPVEPSGKETGVQERFLDFARNDDTGIRIVKHAGGLLPRMIAGASPALSSRAKSRDLYSRRENGECEIAWKKMQTSRAIRQENSMHGRFLDFARNDDTREGRPTSPFLWKGQASAARRGWPRVC